VVPTQATRLPPFWVDGHIQSGTPPDRRGEIRRPRSVARWRWRRPARRSARAGPRRLCNSGWCSHRPRQLNSPRIETTQWSLDRATCLPPKPEAERRGRIRVGGGVGSGQRGRRRRTAAMPPRPALSSSSEAGSGTTAGCSVIVTRPSPELMSATRDGTSAEGSRKDPPPPPPLPLLPPPLPL